MKKKYYFHKINLNQIFLVPRHTQKRVILNQSRMEMMGPIMGTYINQRLETPSPTLSQYKGTYEFTIYGKKRKKKKQDFADVVKNLRGP